MRYTCIILAIIAGLGFNFVGCSSSPEGADNASMNADPYSEPATAAPKLQERYVAKEPYSIYTGAEDEFNLSFKYPGFWTLTRIPGDNGTPGVKDPDKRNKYISVRLVSTQLGYQSLIYINVTKSQPDPNELIELLKGEIPYVYPDYRFTNPDEQFLYKLPKLVTAGEARTVAKTDKIDTVRRIDSPRAEDPIPAVGESRGYKPRDDYKEYVSSSDKRTNGLPSEVFKRENGWVVPEPFWRKIDYKVFANAKPVSFGGEFIHEDNLYLAIIKVSRVNGKTVSAMFICPRNEWLIFNDTFDLISETLRVK